MEKPFPDEDTSMLLTDEEAAAAMDPPMGVEEFRALKHPFQERADAAEAADEGQRIARKVRAAEIAAKRAASPLRRIDALEAGESLTFLEYTRCSQVSSAIATVSARSAKRFKSAAERSLVDGIVWGVRVTRIA